jgi:hypothetical protein
VLDIEFLHGAMSEVEAEHALCTDTSPKLTMTTQPNTSLSNIII